MEDLDSLLKPWDSRTALRAERNAQLERVSPDSSPLHLLFLPDLPSCPPLPPRLIPLLTSHLSPAGDCPPFSAKIHHPQKGFQSSKDKVSDQ